MTTLRLLGDGWVRSAGGASETMRLVVSASAANHKRLHLSRSGAFSAANHNHSSGSYNCSELPPSLYTHIISGYFDPIS